MGQELEPSYITWQCGGTWVFNQGVRFSRRPGSFLAGFLAVMACTIAGAARAQNADPADIAEGMRLFHHEADCQACHGWAGDGRKMDNQAPDGANLRESKLDRQTLILTIKCGRPGAEMPAFDKFAYSDGRCYGLKAADLKARQLSMFDPPTTLAPSQIENLADFLMAKVIGKGPMDHAKCIEFWGSDVELCKEFPK
jgi:mono/diheme cytochrome c family protein